VPERRFLSSHREDLRPVANARLDDAAAYAAAAADDDHLLAIQ
jgi:hypothetical protein